MSRDSTIPLMGSVSLDSFGFFTNSLPFFGLDTFLIFLEDGVIPNEEFSGIC